MEKILVVIDMQNDFIDGSLGTKEAQTIVPNVIKKIKEYKPNRFENKMKSDKIGSYYKSKGIRGKRE